MALVVSGIPVEIHKKNIKNMHLYVKPPNGRVMVSAPITMKDETIERFVRTKTSWIKKQKVKFDNQMRESKREYVSGETFYVWGKQYYLQIEYGNKSNLKLSGDKAIFTVRPNSTVLQREKYIREWYRKQLTEEINKLLPKWEKKTGLKCEEWQTRYMTSRWGSCKPKKRSILLNLQLAKKPPQCLEFIILHELLHFVEKHHNERFYSLMNKYMPMWKEIKSTLNEQTLDYME